METCRSLQGTAQQGKHSVNPLSCTSGSICITPRVMGCPDQDGDPLRAEAACSCCYCCYSPLPTTSKSAKPPADMQHAASTYCNPGWMSHPVRLLPCNVAPAASVKSSHRSCTWPSKMLSTWITACPRKSAPTTSASCTAVDNQAGRWMMRHMQHLPHTDDWKCTAMHWHMQPTLKLNSLAVHLHPWPCPHQY